MIDQVIAMQDIRDNYKTYTFPTMQGDGMNQDAMNQIKNDDNKTYENEVANDDNVPDVPVDILSVPTKDQDGNANFQYDVSPMPISNTYAHNTTAPVSSTEMGSGYYISPMPPTPNTAADLTETPSSSISKDRNTLAALYHSSRRSRRDSPMPPSTYATAATASQQGFLPPPPLASASPKPSSSFHSTTNNSTWNTSVGSMSGYIQAPPLYNSSLSGEVKAPPDYNASQPTAPQAVSTNEPYLTPLLPAKQTVSMSQFEFTPNTTMDRHLLDLANESSANMCMEQFSRFTTRSRAEFEGHDEGVAQGPSLPPSKKPKAEDNEQTPGSSLTNLYSAMAYPNPETSPRDDRVEESIQSLLALSKNEQPLTHELVARHEKQQEESAAAKRDQDIIRRKVQRLLLIRHATRCKVPLTSSEAEGSQECPVSSHCAEGKRLASHIRKCKDADCRYKWCLSTRDVLGHYRSCRDRKCPVCNPVRAMHRREEQKAAGGDMSDFSEQPV